MHLDLPDSLAGEPERSADLLERLRLRIGEAVPQGDYLAFAVGEGGESADQRLTAQRDLDLVLR